jgi:hypothetical protein
MKVLINTTSSDIEVEGTGITVPANGQHEIPQQDYLLWAASEDIAPFVNSGDIVVKDDYDGLIPARGLDYLKYPDRAFHVRFDSCEVRDNCISSKNVQEAIEEVGFANKIYLKNGAVVMIKSSLTPVREG